MIDMIRLKKFLPPLRRLAAVFEKEVGLCKNCLHLLSLHQPPRVLPEPDYTGGVNLKVRIFIKLGPSSEGTHGCTSNCPYVILDFCCSPKLLVKGRHWPALSQRPISVCRKMSLAGKHMQSPLSVCLCMHIMLKSFFFFIWLIVCLRPGPSQHSISDLKQN